MIEINSIKIAICITFHYNEHRLKYLEKVINEFDNLGLNINITIITNTNDPLVLTKIKNFVFHNISNIYFFTPIGLGHPYLLAWSHLEIFRKQVLDESFTHFLYIEDDILITKKNIDYWLINREILRPYGLIPSFFRYEINNFNKKFYSSDVVKPISIYDCKLFKISENKSFINIPYPYQGLYFLDRELLLEHLNGPSSCPDFDHNDSGLFRIQSHDMRARAAFCLTFINIPKGYRSRNVLLLNGTNIDEACLVHHLPNNYTNNPDLIGGKVLLKDIFQNKSISSFLSFHLKTLFKTIFKYYINKKI